MKKVAIIGAGLGGLVAGNLLAKKGHRVTLFESHSSVGGYTAGFWRKGFYFESGTLSLESTPTFYKALEDIGVRGQIRLVKKQDRFVNPYFDTTFETFQGFREVLYRAFPMDKARLDGYFAELEPFCKAMRPFVNKITPVLYTGPRQLLAILPYVLKGRPLMKFVNMYKDTTSSELAGRHFPQGSPLYRILGGIGYPNMGVTALAGMFTAIAEDYWYMADGMQHLANVLAEAFRTKGGDLRLRTKVSKILTRQGRAVGVEVDGARQEYDFVISACDYKRTFTELLDDASIIPPAGLAKIKNAAVSDGVFTVFLGLSMTNDELRGHMRGPGVAYDTYAQDADPGDVSDADLFTKTGVSLHSPSLINPALAPEGKSSLMLMTMAPAGWQNRWGGGDRDRYRTLKEAAKDALIAKAESVVPGLRARIEFEDAATPLTYERYTGNTDGATSAWSWDPHKRFYEKGFAGFTVKTPVKNLFIGSCWANQIGGIPSAIAAAYASARKVR